MSVPLLRVLSFNLRTADANDGPNAWPERSDHVFRAIRELDPDLLGLQETTVGQWEQCRDALGGGWDGAFGDRRDPKYPGSHGQSAFWRRARFAEAGRTVFWLSDTPHVPGSITYANDWGARIVLAVRLTDRAAARDLVFAVAHFDTNPACWLPSTGVMTREIERFAPGVPAVATGDFNCPAGSAAWRWLTGEGGWRDPWTELGMRDDGVVTFHGFTGLAALPLDRPDHLKDWLAVVAPRDAAHVVAARNLRIDWIPFRGPFAAVAAAVDARSVDGRVLSDHFPVTATLRWAA